MVESDLISTDFQYKFGKYPCSFCVPFQWKQNKVIITVLPLSALTWKKHYIYYFTYEYDLIKERIPIRSDHISYSLQVIIPEFKKSLYSSHPEDF